MTKLVKQIKTVIVFAKIIYLECMINCAILASEL